MKTRGLRKAMAECPACKLETLHHYYTTTALCIAILFPFVGCCVVFLCCSNKMCPCGYRET